MSARRLLVVALVFALAGAGAVAFALVPAAPSRAAAAVGPLPEGPAPLGRSVPVTLDVPAVGVHASLRTLGLNPDGTVEVPPLGSPDAGWYENSPTPGEPGPAVVLGHVDSARSGPGVFFDLRAAAPGDAIAVTRANGSVARFRVDRIGTYPKSAFPTAEVYGDLDHPGLRLITCGGHFDRAARSWTDNVIVYASAASEQVG
jgi:hypothetical protein